MPTWQEKKQFFDSVITLYGRKPALELLADSRAVIFRLHLADSNAPSDIMAQIEQLALARGVEIHRHSRNELSRISKNARQDQGVAIDIQTSGYRRVEELNDQDARGCSYKQDARGGSYKHETPASGNNFQQVIVLDGVTNPQNLGLVIRSVTASPMTGLVLPRKGCARLDPLVHKASAGTLLRANIFHCPQIEAGLRVLQQQGFELIGLDNNAARGVADGSGGHKTIPLNRLAPAARHRAWVLGNESAGLSPAVRQRCDLLVSIPMRRGVDSINVAAAATLVAFRSLFA